MKYGKTGFYLMWFVASIPLSIFRAWVFVTIYNAFMPQLFGLPQIPSIWYAALIGLLVQLLQPMSDTNTGEDEETRAVKGCSRTIISGLVSLIALGLAWLYMQLGGIS